MEKLCVNNVRKETQTLLQYIYNCHTNDVRIGRLLRTPRLVILKTQLKVTQGLSAFPY